MSTVVKIKDLKLNVKKNIVMSYIGAENFNILADVYGAEQSINNIFDSIISEGDLTYDMPICEIPGFEYYMAAR